MTTIYDSTRTVKPATAKTFAAGLTRRPARFVPSPADEAWYLEHVVMASVADAGPTDADFDRLAGESEAVALMERGIRPF